MDIVLVINQPLPRHVAAVAVNVGDNVVLALGRRTIVYMVTDAAGNSDRDVQFIDVGMPLVILSRSQRRKRDFMTSVTNQPP
jgi:hypothetical protein